MTNRQVALECASRIIAARIQSQPKGVLLQPILPSKDTRSLADIFTAWLEDNPDAEIAEATSE